MPGWDVGVEGMPELELGEVGGISELQLGFYRGMEVIEWGFPLKPGLVHVFLGRFIFLPFPFLVAAFYLTLFYKI